ncbi:MAG TPA: bifunctional transaldolase/phosoglucose isomerase [Anaeromyxobacteraceae bacterium]|nr:bifunctional transaldolase/phosoglucose isomerase [Anaeromyxobacteraceae bacterium]
MRSAPAPAVRPPPPAPVAPRPRPSLPAVGPQTLSLPPALAGEVRGTLAEWAAGEKMARLWRGDATLWTGRDEDRWVGWLRLVEQQRARREEFGRVAEDVRLAGFGHVLVLGMGGSSLCPDVFARTFGQVPGFPRLRVLDSTVPAQVRAAEREVDLRRTLFVVASKSGTTVEPEVLLAHFLDRTRSLLGNQAGGRFVAITDPGTELERLAQREGFRKVFHGVPSVGGRYSALSHFGMVPAAAMGVGVPRLLDRAQRMADACAADRAGEENPGLALGVVLGAAARDGIDKLSLVASPGLAALGDWIEQLVAESLGKQGKGMVPLVGERLAGGRDVAPDRLVVHTRLAGDASPDQDRAVAALERAGTPVVRIDVADPADLGQEFFRWEVATAVAGAILGVNPFDQPDVEAAKAATRELTAAYEVRGAFPDDPAVLQGDGLRLHADEANARALAAAAREGTPAGWIRAHVARAGRGDYLAVLAFLEASTGNGALLREIREALHQATRAHVTLGLGPRYLHSTGQLHKGGPDEAVLVLVTADDAEPLPIPGRRLGFGELCRAQARGDHEVLARRGRRVLRIHLGSDVRAGLAALRRALPR